MIRNKNFHFTAALTGSAMLSCISAAPVAQAGSFAVREQSAYFQGMAFAGSAAGVDISSMFWNPAATAALPGINDSENATGIFGSAKETATSGLLATPFTPNSADVGTNNLVASSYSTYQVNDRLWLGVAMDAPFGSVTKPDNAWAGSALGVTTRIFSLEATPSVAYKITPEVTLGAGVRIDYFEVRLTNAGIPAFAVPNRSVKADDWGVGGVAGLIWEPSPGTAFGVGYRSAMSLDVSGAYRTGPTDFPGGFYARGTAGLTLPDEVTASVRQVLNPQWTALATVEWQNWSRIGNVNINAPALGTTLETLNLNYRDGWFFSAGAEYAYSSNLTLRGGVAYEISPVYDRVRDILLPDSNRIHLGIGGTYKVSERVGVNVAYSHIFFEDAPFCIADRTSNGGTSHCTGASQERILLQGHSDNSADLVAASLNLQLSAPAAALESYKK
jgi:long-chain fatty acid transport protein